MLANPEFRAMYLAHLFSITGDQVAKVALAILVYQRTSSAALSAFVYALTLLPWLATPALAGFGDRYPRRDVLVACDVARAALVGLMVIPGTPLAVLLALLALVSLLAPPFESTRAALLADVLSGREYVLGSALSQLSLQAGQVVGFAAGGALVGALTARGALAVDAASFAASTIALLVAVRHRPAPTDPAAAARPAGEASGGSAVPAATPDPGITHPAVADPATANPGVADPATANPGVADSGVANVTVRGGQAWTDGLRYVFGDPRLRSLVLLAWAVAFFTIPAEGLAVAVVGHHGGSAAAAGLLTAAGPFGLFLGVLVVSRQFGLERQLAAMLPLAILAVAPLGLSAMVGNTAGLFCLWVVAGAGGACQLAANASFVRAVDPRLRSRAFGVAQAGLQLAQAGALLLAGVAADYVAPVVVVSVSGVLGVVVIAAIWLALAGTKVAERAKQA